MLDVQFVLIHLYTQKYIVMSSVKIVVFAAHLITMNHFKIASRVLFCAFSLPAIKICSSLHYMR